MEIVYLAGQSFYRLSFRSMVQINVEKRGRGRKGNKLVLAMIAIACLLLGIVCFSFFQIRALETSNNLSKLSSSTSTSTSSSNLRKLPPFRILTDVLIYRRYDGPLYKNGGDALWDLLLKEGAALKTPTAPIIHAMEVGMHKPKQCLEAARLKFETHCVEPSPASKHRILKGIDNTPMDVKENIKFYQMAAADKSGISLEFSSAGGTGDHVSAGGAVDIWTMTKTPNGKEPENTKKEIVQSVSIDDIIYDKIAPTKKWGLASTSGAMDKLFLLKIDTQGFEPTVFSGLTKALEENKIDYIIFEYWPKGIDFMNDMETKCIKPVEILKALHTAGYLLYAMPNVSHPSSLNPLEAKKFSNDERINNIPYDDVVAHCMWYYSIEQKFPSQEYKMGYWTDILAVSRNARLPKTPITELGQILRKRIV